MRNKIKIDPRIFISPPYYKCPKCQRDNSFGVLMVTGLNYTRRCQECWFTETYKLPPLEKKIIYLDQFAISEMMKAINEKLGKTKKVDGFWLGLFENLELLTKSQLIICPDSTFHRDESLLYEYQPLKRMYEHFSHGATFYDPATVRRFQIAEQFRKSVLKENPPPLTRDNVIHGRIDEWQERLLVSVDFKFSEKEINSLRETRDKTHASIAEVFERWKTEKDKKFDDWFKEEGLAWGRTISQRYIQQTLKWHYLSTGQIQLSPEETMALVMNDDSALISNLLMYLPKGAGKIDEDSFKKAFGFLASEELLEVPFNRISASLWATIAHQAAYGGRKNPPNAGMVNDIDMVSTLLPYCDAMFVDSEMAGLLNHGPVKRDFQKRYKTEIFSPSNKADFVKYLDAVKNKANKEHVEKVREVYGDDWGQPYYSMYETRD